jgi:hypothetical protein
LVDVLQDRREHGRRRPRTDGLAQTSGRGDEALDLPVAGAPDPDRPPHQGQAAEVPVEARHLADVVGMVAALQEPAPHDVEVRLRPVELLARDPVAERNRDRGLVRAVRRFVARVRVPVQRVDRVLLGLGPEPLAADVRANPGEQRHAALRDERDRERHREADREQNDRSPPGGTGRESALPSRRRPQRFLLGIALATDRALTKTFTSFARVLPSRHRRGLGS